MDIWTDAGARALEFLGPSLAGRWSEELPGRGSWAALWPAFFSHREPRLLRLERSAPPARRTCIVLVEQSPRSNLDILAELQRARAPLPAGLVCAALQGRGFLGRHDRSWRTLAGNLHAVVRLTPALPLEQIGCAFSILPAVATLEVLRARAGEAAAVGIKWINDLVCGRRKVAGFLTRQSYQAPLVTEVLLGIGVNLGADPALEPDPFVPATGCLADLFPGPDWSPGRFLLELLERIHHWCARLAAEGLDPLLERYRAASCVLGRAVRIYADGPGLEGAAPASRDLLARGEVAAIGDDLALAIRCRREPIARGRLAFEEDCVDPRSPAAG